MELGTSITATGEHKQLVRLAYVAHDRVKITVCTDKGPKYAHEKQNYAPVRSSSAGSVTAI